MQGSQARQPARAHVTEAKANPGLPTPERVSRLMAFSRDGQGRMFVGGLGRKIKVLEPQL